MPVTVVCPSCKAKLKAPEALLGKAVKCPGCGSAVLVKAAAPAAPAAAPKAASGSAPKVPALAKGKPATPPPARKPQPLDELDPVDEVEDIEDIEDYDEPAPTGVTKAKRKKAAAVAEEEPDRGPVSDNDKTMGMAIHLATFINIIAPPFGYVVPMGIWVMKKKESPFIDHNGKEWLNFTLSMFVLMLVASILLGTLGAVLAWAVNFWVGLIFFILLGITAAALGLYVNIMYILAGLKAKKGEWVRYKCLFRVFK